MHKANDIIGQIFLVIFFFVMCATPLTILVLGIINFVRAKTRRGTIVLQNLASQIIWMFLSYVVVLIFMMMVFNAKYPLTAADEWKTTAWFIVAGVIYAMAGAALIYWTKRQARLSRVASTVDNGPAQA